MRNFKFYFINEIKLVVILIIFISFLISIYLYPLIPERIVIHWNAEGEPDGYTTKIVGIFILPFVLITLSILFLIIPKIDPLKKNIESFRRHYNIFFVLLLIFLLSIHIWIILWNLGIAISAKIFFPIGFSFLFLYLAVLLENAKRNWFIGIRTPWTLSSDKVWKSTHKLGGKVFRIVAILSFIGIFFDKYSWIFIIIPLILASFYLILYSYLEYEREKREKIMSKRY